jgi:hypothetical protein
MFKFKLFMWFLLLLKNILIFNQKKKTYKFIYYYIKNEMKMVMNIN